MSSTVHNLVHIAAKGKDRAFYFFRKLAPGMLQNQLHEKHSTSDNKENHRGANVPRSIRITYLACLESQHLSSTLIMLMIYEQEGARSAPPIANR